MDVIKENMFFVVMGVVVLIALALFLVLVQPLKSDNAEDERTMKSLESDLRRLVDKAPPNVAAKRAAENFKRGYEEQLASCEQRLSVMELSSRLPGQVGDEPAGFKTVYQRQVDELKSRLRGKAIGADTWHFWDWKESVPREKRQRDLAAKEFALIDKLVNVVIDRDLMVSQVDRIEVNPGETRTAEYDPAQTKRLREEPYFDLHPFVLTIRMPIHLREALIEKLLVSKTSVPVDIRYISMMRIEDDPQVNRQAPPYYVIFRVGGVGRDFSLKKPEENTRPYGARLGG